MKKGKPLTITARLIIANWQTHKDVAFAGQPVKLQIRKGRSGDFTTLKTIKTDRNGRATSTAKATVDGEYRFEYAGTSSSQARAGRAHFVDVK